MQFDHIISTPLDRDELWALLDEAFTDSKVSPIWPNHLEHLRASGIREGERVSAAYRAPVTGIRMKQSYILYDVEPGRTFSYRVGRSHPLVGGGTVELIEQASGTDLRWWGEYDVPKRIDSMVAAAFVKVYFEGRFFDALERNLAAFARKKRAA
jgi:hypothetical protein